MKNRATLDRVYIAYGSNLNREQMAQRCPGARIIGKSSLEGWRLAFMGRPGNAHATILKETGSMTPVLVWAISAEHEAALDIYEGVRGGYYRKEYMTITARSKTYKNALVYIMTPNPYNLPSPQYVGGIIQGYDDAGFHIRPVARAMATATALHGHNPADAKEVK